MRGFISGILALAAASALPVIGQNGAVQPHKAEVTKPQSWVAVPHTAVFMVTIVQKSANGSTNTRSLIQIQARDSQGRTVNASTDVSQGKLVNSSTQYSVTDPVSQTYVGWTSGNKRATVRPMQNIPIPAQHCVAPPAPAPAAVEPAANLNAPESPERIHEEIAKMREMMRIEREGKLPTGLAADATRTVREDLGTATVLGFPVHGYRTTSTTPAGPNETPAPSVETREIWSAMTPGLAGLPVRDVHDWPLHGIWTEELVEFDQEEPNPSLFKPPPDYEIETQPQIEPEAHCPQSTAIPTSPAP